LRAALLGSSMVVQTDDRDDPDDSDDDHDPDDQTPRG
jgi:hypothetical protein